MYSVSSLVLLLLLLNFDESHGFSPYPPRPRMNNTATGLYNYQTQKCCLGKIHESLKANYQKCCGAGVYDSSKQLCCNDEVIDMAPAMACCGNKAIDTDKSICCEDQKVDIPQDDASLINYAKCCGPKSYYDDRTHTCCRVNSGVKVVDGANKLCCGEEVYEDSNQVCCISYKNDTSTFKLLPKDDDGKTICCGDSLIDYITEYCCDDKVVNMDGCCGNKAFNTSTQLCRNNQDIIEKNGNNMQSCGDEVYDENSQVCCYDMVNNSYTLSQKTNANQTDCCGIQPYDPEKQLCCYKTQKLVAKANKDDYECCGETSINSAKQQCCGGKLIDINTEVCCGEAEIYDPTTKICCTKYSENGTLEGHAIKDNPDYKIGCCGLQTYDYSEQMCCGNTLVPNSRNTACCDEKPFDFNKEVCCTDTVYPKKSGQHACCFFGTTDAKPEYPTSYPYDDMLRG